MLNKNTSGVKCMWLSGYEKQHCGDYHVNASSSKPEPIMLSDLPIIPSRISHNFYPLLLFLFPCHHLLFLLYSLNFYSVSDK